MKFCKDCKHYRHITFDELEASPGIPHQLIRHHRYTCHANDPVLGKPKMVSCDSERHTGICGPDAKLFEAKD